MGGPGGLCPHRLIQGSPGSAFSHPSAACTNVPETCLKGKALRREPCEPCSCACPDRALFPGPGALAVAVSLPAPGKGSCQASSRASPEAASQAQAGVCLPGKEPESQQRRLAIPRGHTSFHRQHRFAVLSVPQSTQSPKEALCCHLQGTCAELATRWVPAPALASRERQPHSKPSVGASGQSRCMTNTGKTSPAQEKRPCSLEL